MVLSKHVIIVVVLLAAMSSVTEAADGYALARAPQRSQASLIRDWQPLVEYLGRETGVRFYLETYSSSVAFEGSLISGTPDFFFTSPYYFLIARQRHGYIPLIRGKKPLVGILVVRDDSGIASVNGLQGKTLAFPSPNAYAASLYMRALLAEKEKVTFTPIYVETHDNVYRNVVFRNAAGGGGVLRTLNAEPQGLSNQLRVIYRTPGSASHPLSAHPRVPQEVREAVAEALLKLATVESGRKLLDRLKLRNPVRANHERDYAWIKALGLEKYASFSP